jgi:hypothetical protein
MIEFASVSREFRGLVGRRRDLQTLLGSVFAGMGIFLQNALQGGVPESLGMVRRHVFAFYAIMLMVPCVLLALRMARLHGGMVLNGVLFARLMQGQDFTARPGVDAAARHNFSGVSFLQFALMDLLAGFSTAVLMLALDLAPAVAVGLAAGAMVGGMALYFAFHRRAARFALARIAAEACGPVGRDEWEGHIRGSLEDANAGLNAEVAFAGLIVFSVFETLSGLGQIKADGIDLAPEVVSTRPTGRS